MGELLQKGYTIQSSHDSPVPAHFQVDSKVIEYGSVIAKNTVTTSKGDFIQFLLNDNVSFIHVHTHAYSSFTS